MATTPQNPSFSSPQSILIVRLSAIGDVVCTLPMLEALRRAFPDAQLDWVADEVPAQLLIGQGVLPRDWHPMADMIAEEELTGFLASLSGGYERKAATLPTHAEAVNNMIGTRELA